MANVKKRTCKICKTPISGRSDKIFCSLRCKTDYYKEQKKNIPVVITDINEILARNRSVLFELTRNRKSQRKIRILDLENKGFNFRYCTHISKLKKKDVYWCYDMGWTEVSYDEVLIKLSRKPS